MRLSLSPICSAIATASPPTACRNEGSVVISASELTAHRGAVREILKSRAVSGTSANFSRGAVAAGNFPVPLTRPARGSPRRAGARAPRRRAATSRSRLVSIPALAPIHPGDAHNLRPHVQPVTGRACPVARIEFQRRHRGSCSAHVQSSLPTASGASRAAIQRRAGAGPQICDPALHARFNGEPAIGRVAGARLRWARNPPFLNPPFLSHRR